MEYTFTKKHKELLAEPVTLAGIRNIDTEDNKTETGDDNNEMDTGASQSNASLLKSQRKKMRMMSLMELLDEYTKSK